MANFLDLIKGEGEAVMFIRSLINTPQSANSILRQLRDAGLAIRQQTGLQVIAYLRDVSQPAGTYIQGLGLNQLPNVTRLAQSITKQLRNFAYVVKFSGRSTLTGETIDQHITVSTNRLLTKQQAIDTATQYAEGTGQSGGLEIDSGEVLDVSQNNAGLIVE